MIPSNVLDQVPHKCAEGLALGLADKSDGAVMVFKWINKAFSATTGYDEAEAIGQRGTILVGPDMEQGTHLLIIDKLMKWERFSVKTITNRKNGQPYWVEITWTPLTDTENGDRWWLCSLVELKGIPNANPGLGKFDCATSSRQKFDSYSRELLRLEKENKRLQELAQTVSKESKEDPLTGLYNRRHFEITLKIWSAALRNGGSEFALLYIDLDRFKSVNDTLGHEAGDSLLISVADMLLELTSKDDIVSRLGGDEFVVLRPLGDSALNISCLADKIVEEMHKPFTFEGKSVTCSASIGVAIADAKMEHLDQIVADADTALYHAKGSGRGKWSFFTSEMHAQSVSTKQLAAELLLACENREFIPYFQPLVDAATGMISSVEVLVRWQHPTKGILEPCAFLDVATNMGIVHNIDKVTFARLREAMGRLDDDDFRVPIFGINASAGRLADPTFVHDMKSAGIDPHRLTVEILESVYLERMSDVVRWTLDELSELGVTIAVDDFGTGHASVQGLLQIRPAVLKIDRQFIQPIDHSETARALLSSFIGIGKSLDMKIVAEGVETEQHARLARDMGCDYLQGFYFGKPMSEAELRRNLLEKSGKLWPEMTVFEGPDAAQDIRARSAL